MNNVEIMLDDLRTVSDFGEELLESRLREERRSRVTPRFAQEILRPAGKMLPFDLS